MARKIVSQYAVFHQLGGKTAVVLYYQQGEPDTLPNLDLREAAFVIDLLRNEKPISYDPETGQLSTYSPEPTGEGE
ncbi:MAG: hypothetical protein ACP5SI_01375 [Chloroflexia bacterium]